MAEFTAHFRGLSRLKLRVRTLEKFFKDLRPSLEETKEEFSKIVRENFSSGGPPGEKWAKHSALTRMMRLESLGTYKGGGGSNQILVWRGGLQKSFASGKHMIFKITSQGSSNYQVHMGSSHPLAKLHHDGLTFHRGGIRTKVRRGRHKAAQTLAFYNSAGQIVFSKTAKPATISIPARPFWSNSQAEELVELNKDRIQLRVKEIWNG